MIRALCNLSSGGDKNLITTIRCFDVMFVNTRTKIHASSVNSFRENMVLKKLFCPKRMSRSIIDKKMILLFRKILILQYISVDYNQFFSLLWKLTMKLNYNRFLFMELSAARLGVNPQNNSTAFVL